MTPTEFDIARVYLMLGGKCNYGCRHCIQNEERSKALPSNSKKSIDYIRHLARIRPPQLKKITLMFWGGEPLLYFEQIQKIVTELGDDVEYAMVSNGSLLAEPIVLFCNAHRIHYILSNDGPHTKRVRGENLLEDQAFLDLFRKIENKSIDAVVSAYNQDYYALWSYLDEKIPGIQVFTEFLECTWEMPEDLYDFDINAYRNTMQRIIQRAHADMLNGILSREVKLLQSYVGEIMRIVQKLEAEESPYLPYPRCRQVRKSMNIDLAGNVYACHNFFERIGSVDDEFETLLTRYDALYQLEPSCRRCAYALFCRGGCPFAKDSQGKARCCEIRRIFIDSCLEYIRSFSDALEAVEL